MKKVLIALGLAIALSLIVSTVWFLVFGLSGLPELGGELLSMSESAEYWLGMGIFSLLFFALFTLPFTLLITKN
jgi:hypothetical protein